MSPRIPEADPNVLARARRGEREACGVLYRQFSPMVYGIARRLLVSVAAAEDALQETFIDVFGRIRTWRGEAGFGFWVRRIAVNRCLMMLRSAWESKRSGDEPDQSQLAAPVTALTADHAIDLERALASLPDRARVVVWLHDVEGFTHREIGDLLGHTAGFSKSQLARAHERLRAVLSPAADVAGGATAGKDESDDALENDPQDMSHAPAY
jgi:RNA polymerase sigma factor (sigma-70 family)